MPDDPGEELFDRYIEQRGYSVLNYHPDLGTAKRPDYLFTVRGVGYRFRDDDQGPAG